MSEDSNTTDFDFRFGGIGRLYGVSALENFRRAHACVIGVGGVGSWTVEALARSGIGALTLVDLDDVCLSNTNRQLHALNGNVGKQKVDVLAERIALINPECRVTVENSFLTEASADSLLERSYDVVVDAIDQPRNKCIIIDGCQRRSIPVITVGGAGGKCDPTAVRVEDLNKATHDALLRRVRKMLRSDFGYPNGDTKKWGVPCVFSTESAVYPTPEGGVCDSPDTSTSLKLDCAAGFGAATFVTGTFGFVAAGVVADLLANRETAS